MTEPSWKQHSEDRIGADLRGWIEYMRVYLGGGEPGENRVLTGLSRGKGKALTAKPERRPRQTSLIS